MASNEWLVRKLHEQDKKIEALSRGGTGVGHSSIAPGENLTVISDNGEVVLGAGGVEHVDGPTPATPSAPTLKLGFGTIETTWDGSFAEGEDEDGVPLTAPVDFDVVEVHCSTDPEEEEWGEDTMRGQIKTAEGGTITVGGFDVDDEVFVCLIALAKTGKRSEPSATASLIIEGLDFSQLFNELDAANATIKNAGEILVTEQGTLDEKLTEVDGTLNDLGQDLQAVEDAQAQLNTDLTDVMTSVDGKNTITWNPSAPSPVSTPGKAVGDLWYRTAGNSIVGFWKWDGSTWVTQLLDKTTIPLIDIGAGTFGTLNGSRLVAGSVAASSIAVGDFSNLATIDPIRNTQVTRPANWSTETVGDYITPKADSQNYLMFKDRTNTVPFKAGDTLRVVFKGVSAAAGNVLIRLWGYPKLEDEDTTGLVGVSGDLLSMTTTEQQFSGTVTIPSTFGASTILKSWIIGLGPSGGTDMHGVKVRDVRVYRMNAGEMVVDGSITTNKLAADVLEVKNLKATTGQLNEAVINKLFSDVVVAKTAVANAFIGENAILTGAVTAPKITASEELWAKIAQFVKIRAEHIEADAIDGMVITGPTIQSAREGQRWVGDTTGIRIFNADNEVRTKLSPDDSVFKGEVEADTLVVNGGSELRSTENKLGQGAKLTLESGVTDPTAPPTVQTFWDTLDFDIPNPDTCYGLAWADNKYWTYVDVLGTTVGDRVVSINPTTGAVGDTIPMTDGFWAEGGITAMGSELFLLGRKTGENYKYFVRVYSTAGTFLREWEYKEVGWSASNPLGYKPCIGASSTRIYIAHCSDDGELIWRTYDKTTGALLGMVNTGYPTSSDLLGAYIGEGDWGVGDRIAIVKKTTRQVIVLTTAGANEASLHWNTPPNATGIVYQGGKFRTLDPNRSITNYESPGMGDNTSDWWATYRWAVDEDENGVNDYTSRIGPVKRFYWDRRARVRFMGAPMPVGVGYITPSIAKKTSTPSRTDFRTPSFSVYVGESTAWLSSLPSDWQSGPAPGDTNDFPDSEPSTLVSASSTFEVKGDGSGRWGPLTFNSDGTMSSSQVPAWVPITTFESGFEPRSWGDVPAYRIWPDGKVEWRGVISGTLAATGSSFPLLTIPAAARPGRPKNYAVATTGSAIARVEFGPTVATTKLYYYTTGTAGTWVAIDGIYYYLD